ncbi:F-box domain-containing protein [Colletotrichum abscissum]|uniref:F-box domain-containing protein n=1 Tax=Colletotrichum abscissum TaxID=1671311 RepID=A0A9P9XBT2_9PEZI|nr:F-box domain-containing protein [Colletotrichum abscissum]KAI3544977.1 F-box domain-containing protein [Colletotrichum abscissum]KAK1478167.1 F-box domain-containing protein [Colletotrichum abscissum]
MSAIAPIQFPGQPPTNGGSGGFPLQRMPQELILEILRQMDNNNISLLPISKTSRLMRGLSIPIIFRVAQISCAEDALADHVMLVFRNRLILRSIQVLSIYTEGPPTSRTPGRFVQVQGPKAACRPSTPTDIMFLIGELDNLREIRMDFRFKATLSLIRPLSRIMDAVQWDLSLVTALSFPVTTDIGFIVTGFPNLKAFSFEAPLNKPLSSIDGLSDLASILGPQLAYIQICKMRWDASDFQEVQAIFPQISRLTMGGTMAFGGSPVRPRWDLQLATGHLTPMANLKVLALSDERCQASSPLDAILPVHYQASTMAKKLLPAIGFHDARSRRYDQAWRVWQNLPNLEVLYIMDRAFQGHCFVPVKDKQGQLVDVKFSDGVQEFPWPVV